MRTLSTTLQGLQNVVAENSSVPGCSALSNGKMVRLFDWTS